MKRHSTRLIAVCGLLLGLTHVLHGQDLNAEQETTSLSGLLVNESGQPIVGATVEVIAAWRQTPGYRELASGGGSGISNDKGEVTIEGLPKDRILSLRFTHPDFQRYWFEATTAADPTLARNRTRYEIFENNFRASFDRPRNVQVRLVGNDATTPLADVVVEARPAPDSDQIHFDQQWCARGKTDLDGIVTLPLSQGIYELSLGDERPLDCIAINETRIAVRGVEHAQVFLRMTRRGADVVFKAIDADSGEPIAGVSFWRENPEGEYWFEIVRDENIGAETKDVRGDDGRKAPYVTGNDGLYQCQMRAARGWTYHVYHRPEGYEEVDAAGQKFDIPSEGRLEKTFLLRKKSQRDAAP